MALCRPRKGWCDEGAWTQSGNGGAGVVRTQVAGSPQDFPKTKEAYVNWGDLEEDGERGARFRGEPLEPYTAPLAK